MCDTFVARTDSGLIWGKNSDRDPNEAQFVEHYPATDHPAGQTLQCSWSRIEQVRHTHAVAISRPWWLWGAEMGANEHGVVVGNEAVFTRRTRAAQPTGTELLGMDLVRLALERAASAAAAVEVIVSLLERHGQGGACSHEHPRFSYDNSFLIADPARAFVLETAGRRWAAEEVTSRGRSISNALTISGFAEVYADPLRGRVAQAAARRACTTSAAATLTGAIGAFAALRDHGASGRLPTYSMINGALGGPCAHAGGLLTSTQTTSSWVADLTGPEPRHWVTGTSAPCLSVFRPLDWAAAPGEASNRFDPAVEWWQHEAWHRAVLASGWVASEWSARRDAVEGDWVAHPPSPVEAAQAVGDLREKWRRDSIRPLSADPRPLWLRQLWRRWNRAARLSAASQPPSAWP